MSAVDPAAIKSLRDLNPGDESFLRDLIQIYLEDAPRRLTEIEAGLAESDGRKVASAAHSLKGSSANFGVRQLRALCEQAEQFGKRDSLAEARALLPSLQTELTRVRTELEGLLPPA